MQISTFRFALFASFLLHLLVIIWGDLWYWFNPPATSFPISVEIVSSGEIARARTAAQKALTTPKPAPVPTTAPPEEAPSEEALPEKALPEKALPEKALPEKKPEDNLSETAVKEDAKPALSQEMTGVFDTIQNLEGEKELEELDGLERLKRLEELERLQELDESDNIDPPEAEPSGDFDNLLSEALGVDNLSPEESDSSLISREDVFSSNILTAAEQIRLRSQLAQCWSPPAGGFSSEAVIVEMRLILNPDATIKKMTVLPPGRAQDDKLYSLAVENARRALLDPACIPLKLPDSKYDLWRETILRFSPGSLSG